MHKLQKQKVQWALKLLSDWKSQRNPKCLSIVKYELLERTKDELNYCSSCCILEIRKKTGEEYHGKPFMKWSYPSKCTFQPKERIKVHWWPWFWLYQEHAGFCDERESWKGSWNEFQESRNNYSSGEEGSLNKRYPLQLHTKAAAWYSALSVGT